MVTITKLLFVCLLLASPLCAQILTVPNGGTGKGTLAAHGPLIGNGTAPITVGSPGVAGWCYISGGPSADPSFQACPSGGGGGITSINGNTTAAQVITGTAPITVNSAGGTTTVACPTCGGGGMVYPGAGIANSTGAAWGTSYSSGNTIPANFVSTLNQSTTGNAATATALAGTPTLCSAGQYPLGILASGNATGCTLAGSGGGITSINGDATPAQVIAAGAGVAISNTGATHTLSSSPLNPVANIGASYTATAADFASCALKYISSGGSTVTLPINTSQPANGQCMIFLNYGSGSITINRNGQNINGGTVAISIPAAVSSSQINGAMVWSDGTNYFASRWNSSLAFGAITSGSNAGAGALTIGTGTSLGTTGTGTIAATSVPFNGVTAATNTAALVMGSGGTLGFSGTGAIVSPVVNTGVAQGSGLKHQRFGPTCTTTAAVAAACSILYSWTTAFADANYTAICNLGAITTGVPVLVSTTQSATQVGLTIAALTAVAAQATTVECIATHD